jgi:hypothetical protein
MLQIDRKYLPSSTELPDSDDTPLRIYQAVQTIADIEARPIHLVVADIEKVRAV